MQVSHVNICRCTETKSSRSSYKEDLSGEFVVGDALNYKINLSVGEQNVVNTCWHSRIAQLREPFLLPIIYPLPEGRFLSRDEQQIMQRALRRSIRVVAKGTLVSK
jgi:hypothetical protein